MSEYLGDDIFDMAGQECRLPRANSNFLLVCADSLLMTAEAPKQSSEMTV
jgi:hypothetical protein